MIIDIVIPWCGNDFDSNIHTTKEDLLRQKNNNELYYCLESIKAFASWINKIYILVNDTNISKKDIPEPNKTILIDRKKFLENKKITNGFVAETLSWKISELSENFILAHDDIILGKKTLITDFFENDKPVYYHINPNWGPFKNKLHHRIYVKQTPFKGKSPLSCGPYPHFYLSLQKTICQKIENEYNEWFNFMRSHYIKRFDSRNSNYYMEEDFKGIYISYIDRMNLGINKFKPKNKMCYEFGFVEYNEECYDTRLSCDIKNYIPCEQSIAKFKNGLIKNKNCPLFINFNSIHNIKDIEDIWEFIKYEKYKD